MYSYWHGNVLVRVLQEYGNVLKYHNLTIPLPFPDGKDNIWIWSGYGKGMIGYSKGMVWLCVW